MDMLFTIVGGHVVPVAPNGLTPDGVGLLSLAQAAERYNVEPDVLLRMAQAAHPPAAAPAPADPLPPSKDPHWAEYRKAKCPDASDEHFDYFVRTAQERGLNVWADQAYLDVEPDPVTRMPVARIIIGINGMRHVAHATGQYVGIDATDFEATDDGKLIRASVVVYRRTNGERCPFLGEVRFDERYPGQGVDPFWDKMPFDSLGRCAEAAALRRAFTQELGGLYMKEELRLMRGQAGRRRGPQRARGPSLVEQGLPSGRQSLESFLIEKCDVTNRQQRQALMARLSVEFGLADAEDGEPFAAAASAVVNDMGKYGLAA